MIRYRCPRCKKTLTAQDGEGGAKLNCPHCGQRLQVPAPPPPVNKTMLGEPDDRANRTVLGSLEGLDAPGSVPSQPAAYSGQPPAVPRTIVVETDATDAAGPTPTPNEPDNNPDDLEIVDDRPRRRRGRPRYDDDYDYRPRSRPAYAPCPRCGCRDWPRQITKFGTLSIVLVCVGIIFWPLIIVAFLVQEKWDVCQECGEKLRQTGTGC